MWVPTGGGCSNSASSLPQCPPHFTACREQPGTPDIRYPGARDPVPERSRPHPLRTREEAAAAKLDLVPANCRLNRELAIGQPRSGSPTSNQPSAPRVAVTQAVWSCREYETEPVVGADAPPYGSIDHISPTQRVQRAPRSRFETRSLESRRVPTSTWRSRSHLKKWRCESPVLWHVPTASPERRSRNR